MLATSYEEDEPVIYSEAYDPKPIDVEEAILQLNSAKKDVLVFVNRHTGRVNVLYRRKDGHYGLVET
jgi:putative sigma-54 modulation protein